MAQSVATDTTDVDVIFARKRGIEAIFNGL